MCDIIKQIDKSYRLKEDRGWNKLYFVFDIHETILYPSFSSTVSDKFYEYAKETLILLTQRKEITMILWTCSTMEHIKKYISFFEENGINFKYVNENPEEMDSEFACFDNKMYCNVGFDDKFGFDAESDWEILYQYFLNKKE